MMQKHTNVCISMLKHSDNDNDNDNDDDKDDDDVNENKNVIVYVNGNVKDYDNDNKYTDERSDIKNKGGFYGNKSDCHSSGGCVCAGDKHYLGNYDGSGQEAGKEGWIEGS